MRPYLFQFYLHSFCHSETLLLSTCVILCTYRYITQWVRYLLFHNIFIILSAYTYPYSLESHLQLWQHFLLYFSHSELKNSPHINIWHQFLILKRKTTFWHNISSRRKFYSQNTNFKIFIFIKSSFENFVLFCLLEVLENGKTFERVDWFYRN